METTLHEVFSWVCGQATAHTWAVGGTELPCCQRCTGLYLGALAALLSLVAPRPVATGRFLWIHGGFLLVMVPFGFHWLPQGALIRGVTGVLFGFAVVTFLGVSARWSRAVRDPVADPGRSSEPKPDGEATTAPPPRRGRRVLAHLHWTALGVALVLVGALERGVMSGPLQVVSWLVVFGAAGMTILVLTNLGMAGGWAWRRRARFQTAREP